jgi:hypothetical protein
MISNGALDGDPYGVSPFQQVKSTKTKLIIFKLFFFREEHL